MDTRWLLKALTPPIVVIAVKALLRRLRLLPAARSPEEALPEVAPEPPEFEYVPEGWRRAADGWDAGTVAEASQWLGFVVVLVSVVSLALHEHRSGRPAVAVPDRVEDAVA